MWVVVDAVSGELAVSGWMPGWVAARFARRLAEIGVEVRAVRLDAWELERGAGNWVQLELPMHLGWRRLDPSDYLGESSEERLARTGSWWDFEGTTTPTRAVQEG